MTLRGESFVLANEDVDPEGSQFGGNIGVGVLGLGRNNVGFRADLRYYSGFEDDEIDVGESTGEVIGSGVLSDLNFWRANVGFAYRW